MAALFLFRHNFEYFLFSFLFNIEIKNHQYHFTIMKILISIICGRAQLDWNSKCIWARHSITKPYTMCNTRTVHRCIACNYMFKSIESTQFVKWIFIHLRTFDYSVGMWSYLNMLCLHFGIPFVCCIRILFRPFVKLIFFYVMKWLEWTASDCTHTLTHTQRMRVKCVCIPNMVCDVDVVDINQ